MRAAWIERYGPPETVEIRDLPMPEPGEGQVLLRMRACSVNASDVELVTGRPAYARLFGLTRPRFHVLGSDVAGVVEAAGPGASRFAVGDAVFGDVFESFGGFADYAAVPEDRLIAKPDALDFATAAALPQAGVIALQALRDLGAGVRVLINGAGGGMGSFALQIAKARGAHVTAVDRAAKAGFLRALGADRVIDCAAQDFTALGERWDLVLDLFATRGMGAIRGALAPGGRYLLVGGRMRALLSVLTLGTLMSFGPRKLRLLAARQSRDDLAEIAALVAAGRVRAAVDRTYPLEETAQALARVAEGRALGKVVVVMGGNA
ncbi:NAD(P)-dependent alcohol dehydrogenase [Actibacterium sp. MT2.3-13A]|uniref:NAD(P)-dependent alcohol dehydrogenase n=1 Tax=Actibacterium sp. MT2.3-13A TaxID=2828332 RepID=UPI001BACE43D|nr:NAD(P)-dependent alcohol dehydrogenase [Actibacterium sp. MT2.3-13A]